MGFSGHMMFWSSDFGVDTFETGRIEIASLMLLGILVGRCQVQILSCCTLLDFSGILRSLFFFFDFLHLKTNISTFSNFLCQNRLVTCWTSAKVTHGWALEIHICVYCHSSPYYSYDAAFPGLLALVGTSWYGHRIAQDFYNPFTPTNARWGDRNVLMPIRLFGVVDVECTRRGGRYEFGSALFVGWGAAILIMIGGGFLCCNCPKRDSGKAARYPRTNAASNSDKDYV